MPGGKSKSGVQFFPGQKEFAGQLFEPGGFFERILGGAPNPATEVNIARGTEQLTDQLSGQGLTGSGLAARAVTDFGVESAGKREEALLQTIFAAMQPAGSMGVGRGGGLFTS